MKPPNTPPDNLVLTRMAFSTSAKKQQVIKVLQALRIIPFTPTKKCFESAKQLKNSLRCIATKKNENSHRIIATQTMMN